MSSYGVEEQRDKAELGPKKVAENNKRWGDKVKKAKERLAKRVVKISHKGDIGHQITDHKGRVLSEHNWPK